MRLAQFSYEGAAPRTGIIDGDRVYEVSPMGESILSLISQGIDRIERMGSGIPLSEVHLHAPIPRPHADIICLGRNYSDHATEMKDSGGDAQEQPTFFTKAVTSVIGPQDPIPYAGDLTTKLDWEVELAVIIGRTARRVARSDALQHVFGYMVLNDLSARDLQ